jgi:hypothetical protein
MPMERRKFLGRLAGACAAGIARNLGIGAATAVAAGGAAAAAAGGGTAAAAGSAAAAMGMTGVRLQVFEVIVRQAVMGAPWKEICSGPMRMNNITEEDIEKEVRHRIALGHVEEGFCACAHCCERRKAVINEALIQRKAAEAAIPHSSQSPCACKDCFPQVMKMHSDALDKARDRKE